MESIIKTERLRSLIDKECEYQFYSWGEWKRLRQEVLALDHFECQRCKEKNHRYRKAVIVHHIKHLKDRPDLALSIYDPETGERQLISVCKECHEAEHPESQRQYKRLCSPLTVERWD